MPTTPSCRFSHYSAKAKLCRRNGSVRHHFSVLAETAAGPLFLVRVFKYKSRPVPRHSINERSARPSRHRTSILLPALSGTPLPPTRPCRTNFILSQVVNYLSPLGNRALGSSKTDSRNSPGRTLSAEIRNTRPPAIPYGHTVPLT